MRPKYSLTVVIPAYNEEKRIVSTVASLRGYFDALPLTWDLLVVDDGSADGTSDAVRKAYGDGPGLRVISHPRNRGKGAAVRTGMLAAGGDYAIFMDADFSTPVGEFDKFLPFLEQGDAVIIGSRKMPGAQVERRQPFPREFFGKGFTFLANLMMGTGFTDFTCGFKCFRRDAAADIFGRQLIDNWSYDAEILFLASRLGYPVREVPVRWLDSPNSKVRLLRDILSSFYGLLKITFFRLAGRYEREP
jgi:dolichyl-phosphate beta-glucosyltransferase